jgi:hypothetical protein
MLKFRKVDQKSLRSFEVGCWRTLGKISWTNRIRNEEVLQSQEEEEYPTHKKRRKASWIGHFLCRNYRLKHVKGKLEEKKSDEKTKKKGQQLLNGLK